VTDQTDTDPDVQPATNTVIGRRLTILGAIGAVAVGAIWFAQKNSHDDSADLLGSIIDTEPFNSTPYMIAMAIAVAVFLLGAVLQTGNKSG